METVTKISHLQHVLLRPDSYVGSVTKVGENRWIKDGDKFTLTPVNYSPALLKIFDELLVNALDRNTLFPTEVKSISISINDDGSISVENNGPLGGIAITQNNDEGLWNPELTFGHLLTSSNYDDNTERYVGGRNGYGAKLANIFSKRFTVSIKDPVNKKIYTQVWEDNMSKCNTPTIKKYSSTGSSVCINFLPDWNRFGMRGMDDNFLKIIEKRVWDSQICTSKICKLVFQGENIPKINFKQYCQMYPISSDSVVYSEVEGSEFAIASSMDGFMQVSFVNGICTTCGGSHVDAIVNGISKVTGYRASTLKNAMFVFVKSSVVNPTFSSQLKTEPVNSRRL